MNKVILLMVAVPYLAFAAPVQFQANFPDVTLRGRTFEVSPASLARVHLFKGTGLSQGNRN
jgi:hypothetical protein